jgi:DNA-binding transcriptional LysR family regulator
MCASACYARGMVSPDLNLLIALDVLLAEGSVARAARRLRLSPSAMSRTLARLREATGDPLLVRAGRGLVPTPHALELRDRVAPVVAEAEAVLRPARMLDLAQLRRTFTLRTSDGFVENFGPGLIARTAFEAPGVRLRFVPKHDKESAGLRFGEIDLDTGVVGGDTGPEIRVKTLFHDRFVGVVAKGHQLSRGEVTPSRYAGGRHILVSRRSLERGPVDDALDALNLRRDIAVVVFGFAAALSLSRSSDLVATVPETHTGNLRAGMHTFPLPVVTPEIVVGMLWHPRMEADPAHRWLRTKVSECVRDAYHRRP